jgi:hypothetical protein
MYRSDVDKMTGELSNCQNCRKIKCECKKQIGNTMTQSFEERFKEKFKGVFYKYSEDNGGEVVFQDDNIIAFILQEKELSRKEERERQFDLIMRSLPTDAENLSTLTPDQAIRLIRSFISKNPWN